MLAALRPMRVAAAVARFEVGALRTMATKGKKSKAAAAAAASVASGRSSALTAALNQIEKAYGKGSVMQLGDRMAAAEGFPVIPTGSLTLDKALGIGGLPKGRVVEIFGPESSGKTTIALHVIAEAQRAGLNCTFIDVEHAIDPSYASNIGVNIDDLYLAQPDAGEQALEIADTLVRSGAMDVVVVDSVAALVPKAELEGEMGDHHMALQARLMSQALRKLNASLATNSNCLIIFINQIRSKIGVMFGSPDVTSGGNALKFYASMRLDIRRIAQIKNGDEIVGNRTRIKVIKNKLAPPFRVAEFDMTYGMGVSRVGEMVDVGTELGYLTKSGAWFAWADSGTNFAQGRENAKVYFTDHPEEAERLVELIRNHDTASATAEDAGEEDGVDDVELPVIDTSEEVEGAALKE